jgi:hypothetical protein
MSEFFGRLETELRAAAERPPRRTVPVPAIAVTALLALGLAPIVWVLGSGDGKGTPEQRALQEAPQGPATPADLEIEGFPGAKVVATGEAPEAGPWEIFTYTSERVADTETGEVYQPAGLRCLGIRLLDPPADHSGGISGQCGEFPRTPGFSRIQQTVSNQAGAAREILVYGRVPEEAAMVRVRQEGKAPVDTLVGPIEGPAGEPGDFYLIAVRQPDLPGRVNWLDEEGNEGSQGHELLPP